jgi:hypothetical protein
MHGSVTPLLHTLHDVVIRQWTNMLQGCGLRYMLNRTTACGLTIRRASKNAKFWGTNHFNAYIKKNYIHIHTHTHTHTHTHIYIYIYIYIVTNSQVLYSRWNFITLTVQYTTLDYSQQLYNTRPNSISPLTQLTNYNSSNTRTTTASLPFAFQNSTDYLT